jgi:hypothetical protein
LAAARFYSSTSGSIDLTTSVAAGDTSILVSTTTGLPGTTPFTLVLDPGTNTEEIVTATNISGLTITVTRGVDGSSATSHAAGVGNVRHMATARDFREPQEHIGASSNVHGIGSTGSVVGTDTAQTLTNKTAQAAAAGVKGLIVKGAALQTAPYLEVQDVYGNALWKVTPDGGGTVQFYAGTAVINEGGAANFLGFVAKFTAAAVGTVAAIFKRAASGSTADIVQIQSETGAVLAKFDSAGRLTAPQVTSTGPVTAPNIPTLVQSGRVSITMGNGLINTSQALTFPTAFASAPNVVVTLSSLPGGSGTVVARTVGTTTTGTTIWLYTGNGVGIPNGVTVTVDWVAVL